MAVKPISELTDSSMKNLQALIDSNAVIGNICRKDACYTYEYKL